MTKAVELLRNDFTERGYVLLIQKVGNAERIREKKKKSSTLKKAENRQNEIDRLFAKMYEDRACEKITERNFVMLSSKYQKEQIELEQQITSLREELSKMGTGYDRC